MIIDIQEDSIKVITDEGREQVYIKNKEKVIEEQESSDLTEENNIEKEKEIDLVDKFVDKVSLYFSKNNTRKVAGRFILFFMASIFCFLCLSILDDLIIQLLKETNDIFPLVYSNEPEVYELDFDLFFCIGLVVYLFIFIRLFIASFIFAIKEIERAIKWAVHKIKERREK